MIGEALRLYRVVNRISLDEMAGKLGLCAASLSRIENGYVIGPANQVKLISGLFAEPKGGFVPRKDVGPEKFKPGDRVEVYAPDCALLKYEGLAEGATGTVIRLRNEKVRVEIDGTGSQDSEGHNAYGDYLPEQVVLIQE